MEREDRRRLFFILIVLLMFIGGAYIFGMEIRPGLHDTHRPAPKISKETLKVLQYRN